MAWWRRLMERIRRWWSPPPVGALEAMAELRASKVDRADPEAFRALRNRLGVLVLSPNDRARLWRRARRRELGEVSPLDAITAPTAADLRALRGLVEELERGR